MSPQVICPKCRKAPGVRHNRLLDEKGCETWDYSPAVCFACYWRYKRHGTYEPLGPASRPQLHPHRRRRALAMLQRGMSARAISRELAMCRKTIKRLQESG